MFLKLRNKLGYESVCREVADSITWRRSCRIPLDGQVPDPNNGNVSPSSPEVARSRQRRSLGGGLLAPSSRNASRAVIAHICCVAGESR